MDIDDCINQALEAALRAQECYDPNKGTTMRTHVDTRIRGSLLDLQRVKVSHWFVPLDDAYHGHYHQLFTDGIFRRWFNRRLAAWAKQGKRNVRRQRRRYVRMMRDYYIEGLSTDELIKKYGERGKKYGVTKASWWQIRSTCFKWLREGDKE